MMGIILMMVRTGRALTLLLALTLLHGAVHAAYGPDNAAPSQPMTAPSDGVNDPSEASVVNPTLRLSDEKKTVVSAPNESRDTIDPVRRPVPDAAGSVMGLQILGEIDVKGRSNDLQGIASSASQRQVSNDDFK